MTQASIVWAKCTIKQLMAFAKHWVSFVAGAAVEQGAIKQHQLSLRENELLFALQIECVFNTKTIVIRLKIH